MKMRRIALGLVSSLLFLFCGQDPVSQQGGGGGSDTEYAKVKGCLVSAEGNPVGGAVVSFFNSDSTPSLAKRAGVTGIASAVVLYADTTDSNGIYSLDTINNGVYNMIGSDNDGNKMMENLVSISDSDSVDLGTDTLKPAGSVKGFVLLPGEEDHSGTWVYIGGTGYIAISAVNGSFLLSGLPEGIYALTLSPQMQFQKRTISSIPVASGQTTDIGTVLVNRDESGPPARPEGLTVRYDTLNQRVILSWLRNVESDVVGYRVARRHADSAVDAFTSQLVADTSYTETIGNGLVIGEPYSYHVRAEDDSIEGDFSKRVRITVVSKAVLLPPTAALLQTPVSIGPDSIVLRWTQNRDCDFRSYTVYKGQLGVADSPVDTFTTVTDTSCTVRGLQQNTAYTFAVHVLDSSGLSTVGAPMSITTANAPPATPSLHEPEALTGDSVLLKWDRCTEVDFAAYRIYRDTTANVDTNDVALAVKTAATDTVLSVGSLGSSATFYFRLYVRDGHGSQTPSQVVTSSPTRLSGLSISSGTLTPSFSGSATSYSVLLPNRIDSLGVTSISTIPGASILVNGAAVISAESVKIPLGVGLDTINVQVTASGRQTTYRIFVNRQALKLSALSAGGISLTPVFSPFVYDYQGQTYDSMVVVSATANDSAVFRIGSATAASGQSLSAISLSLGDNVLPLIVSNGKDSANYVVTIRRAVQSSNANLGALGLVGIAISPSFTASCTSYTADVEYANSSVVVQAAAVDANAAVTVNGLSLGGGSSQPISVSVGANTITIEVVAEDQTIRKSYRITITRQPTTLLAHWRFEEGAGVIAHDSSGNGNHLTSTVSNLWGTGLSGNGAYSSGNVSGYVSAANFSFGTEDFSVDLWYKRKASSGQVSDILLYNGPGGWSGTGVPVFRIMDTENELRAYTYTSSSNSLEMGSSTVASDLQWHHIVLVREGNSFRFYIDGTQNGSASSAQVIDFTNSEGRIHVGANGFYSSCAINGWVDEVRVLTYAMTGAEVLDRFNEFTVP